MLVQCRNPECKPASECRRPAHNFDERFSNAQIRTAREKFACTTCGSFFVDVANKMCFACSASGTPPPPERSGAAGAGEEEPSPEPQYSIAKRLVCAECKQSKCRILKDFVVNTEEDECPICGEDMPGGSVKAAYTPCGHYCCPECFLTDIDFKISAKKLVEKGTTGEYTTSCFGTKCKSLLQSNQCISLLPKDRSEKFTKFATEAVVKGELHGDICPFPDCNDAIIELPDEADSQVVTCLSCERRFCRCCKGESLTGKCPKTESAEEARMLAESGIAPCPNCRVNIFRSKGCNRVFCTNCKKNFCWICLELTGNENKNQVLKYAHWMDLKRKKRCPLWGGKRLLKKAEASKNKNPSKAKARNAKNDAS